jgi:type IV fimbrial biogenesis protein FimT
MRRLWALFYTVGMSNPQSRPRSPLARRYRSLFGVQSGFTIIEIMVTVAVLAIILAVGLPNLKSFLVRNQVSAVTSEFSNDISRTRVEAISRNNCATICMSSNTANALTGGTPTCATTGNDWQAGWIVFSNPSCSATQNNPTTAGSTLIAVRQAGVESFTLSDSTSARRFTFDSRGLAAGVGSNFTLAYTPENAGSSSNYRSVCISSAGRVNVKQYAGASACP